MSHGSLQKKALNTAELSSNKYQEKPLVMTDQAGVVHLANGTFCDILGFSPTELVERPFTLVQTLPVYPEIVKHLNAGGAWLGQVSVEDKTGKAQNFELSVTSITQNAGQDREYVYIFRA